MRGRIEIMRCVPGTHSCCSPEAFVYTALGSVAHPWMGLCMVTCHIPCSCKSRLANSGSFCCLPPSRVQGTKTAVTKRKNRLRDRMDLSMCQRVQDQTGDSELQSFFHCLIPLLSPLHRVPIPSRQKKNRANTDSDYSEVEFAQSSSMHACTALRKALSLSLSL